MTIEELGSDDYTLLGELTHASLAEFVVEYFLRRRTWFIYAHHALSLLTVTVIIFVALAQQRSWRYCLAAFGLALVSLFLFVLPLHELMHALAYRLAGARDIRWDYSARMLAVWVIAHRFVISAPAFVFVALAPFMVLNGALILGAILWPGSAVFLLFVLLWHLHGSSGDWSLLNFVWIHRRRGFWTYDDADAGRSWFYGRSV
ncbi:MAG TPA: DUF3267 domain-containing protein [Thermoanaerobaculia bacterium]|nr:DUF3267 domain-containing protein [Thermoanaerobaculia bacterium]